MSSYIEDTLTKGETILLSGTIALRKYWLNFILGGLFIFAAIPPLITGVAESTTPSLAIVFVDIVISALLLMPPIIRYFTNELALTNRRVIAKFGVFSLNAVEIRLEKIESVVVKQGIFGRILGYGT